MNEIKDKHGFKNFYLENNEPQPKKERMDFLTPPDVELMFQYGNKARSLHVALHELLGHGSWRLLYQQDLDQQGESEILNPLMSQKLDKCYKEGENFFQVFKWLANSFEECRADTVSLFLSLFDEPFQIFKVPPEEIK